MDSGLQTAGAMPLQAPGALSVTPAAVVKQLGTRLAPLKQVQVMLSGFGSVYAPQTAVPSNEVTKLDALWTGVLEGGGATVLPPDLTNFPAVAPPSGVPPVSVVSFATAPPGLSGNGCFRIRDDQIGFVANESDFVNPTAAAKVLAPIATELKRTKLTATVIGTVALPEGSPYPLSTKRAKRVVDTLVGLGVARDALTPVGVGEHFGGFIPAIDSDGNIIETLAVQDRLVIIQPNGQACS